MSFQSPGAEKYQVGVYRELIIFSGLKKTESQTWGRIGSKKKQSSRISWTQGWKKQSPRKSQVSDFQNAKSFFKSFGVVFFGLLLDITEERGGGVNLF